MVRHRRPARSRIRSLPTRAPGLRSMDHLDAHRPCHAVVCSRRGETLRVADHIEAGLSRIEDIATAAGADRDSLCRVLRQLVSKRVSRSPRRVPSR